MLRLAARHGTTDIVATPHANTGFEFSPQRVHQAMLTLSTASQGVPRLHHGCDFHLSAANLDSALVSPARYTINGGPYLLVELPEFYTPPAIAAIFDRLQAAGALPIVTHPERNPTALSRIADIETWVAQGAAIQVTAQSFLGRFGPQAKSFSDQLVRRGLIHFIASDAHDLTNRPPVLDEAFSYIAKTYTPETAKLLFSENPAATLAGAPISPVLPAKPRRTWFHR